MLFRLMTAYDTGRKFQQVGPGAAGVNLLNKGRVCHQFGNTAALGIEVPSALLAIADEVIERGLVRLCRGRDVDGRNKPGHDALLVARHERNTL